MKDRVSKVHFIGIGGSGMCGIAEVLHSLGYFVTGSDICVNSSTLHLEKIGIKVFYEHNENNINDVDVVVISSAIKQSNPEVKSALIKNIPIIPRALMLSELIRFKKGIAIAGTHGKTTTTSLVASILGEANLDPTFIIGGKLNSVRTNAKLGLGEYIIAEADESDASFLHLSPLFTIITNIDNDHMEAYDYNLERQHQAFIDFIHRIPFYGKSFLCIDSSNVKNILSKISKPFATYGLEPQADIYASDIRYKMPYMHFVVNFKNKKFPSFEVYLNQPGIHNVQNALGAIGVALECNVSIKDIQNGLRNFTGVSRRFQNLGKISLPNINGTATLIDDYGHHPLEIELTLNTIRNFFPGKRIVLVFQPHRYSRTKYLFEDFINVLKKVDVLILTEVYPAGEDPIDSVNSQELVRYVKIKGKIETFYVKNVDQLPKFIFSSLVDGDILLIMGAGNINKLSKKLLENNAENN